MTANQESMKNVYRNDIDGLRGIAVCAVILYHLEFALFKGGFVGVDVFFVISGFLITRIIVADLQQEKFSFAQFYIRRIRRLFPALFVVATIIFGIAYAVFPDESFQRTAGGFLFSILSTSNFYFLSEAGYFDTAVQMKPFLHTWTLSVEEQFYLVWPLTLVLLMRYTSRFGLLIGILLLGLLSLAASEIVLNDSPDTAFYMMYLRVAEFAIGAALVWLVKDENTSANWVLEVACLAGLCLITYSIMVFDSSTRFPGISSLVPCLGAGLIIYGGQAQTVGELLRNKPLVWIGLISYSLYLVHWPVIVFYSYIHFYPLSFTNKFLLLVAMTIGAVLLHYLIEKPLRKPTSGAIFESNKFFLSVTAISALLMVGIGAYAWTNTANHSAQKESDFVASVLTQKLPNRPNKIRHGSCHFYTTRKEVDYQTTCLESDYVVIGSSTAADIYGVMSSAFPEVNFGQVTGQGCFPNPNPTRNGTCNQAYNFILDNAEAMCSKKALLLNFHQSKGKAFDNIVKQFQNCPVNIYVLGLWAKVDKPVKDIVIRFRNDISNATELNNTVTSFVGEKKLRDYESALSMYSNINGIEYRSMQDLFDDCGLPRYVSPDNQLLMTDTLHLEVPAMTHYGTCISNRFSSIETLLETWPTHNK